MVGKIIKGIGGFYYVKTSDGNIIECRARGVFRNQKEKPYIGDDLRAPEPEDIRRANRMLFVGSVLGLLLLRGLRWWICRVLL